MGSWFDRLDEKVLGTPQERAARASNSRIRRWGRAGPLPRLALACVPAAIAVSGTAIHDPGHALIVAAVSVPLFWLAFTVQNRNEHRRLLPDIATGIAIGTVNFVMFAAVMPVVAAAINGLLMATLLSIGLRVLVPGWQPDGA